MTQSDFQIALHLQQQFEHEASIDYPKRDLSYSTKKLSDDKSLVDPSWELIDPTPNIYNLFVVFDQKYFWNKLQSVCVNWSKRMTSCAGICSYNGRGGLCRISLSEPLLKLRPRKDLIQTLLHEMIHAYLFVTANNKDRDGHGPEFHRHMYRINAEAGTNITVYHDFTDEVRLYQQHWWRCNGSCQHRRPYFGMVRRATNRAPGPNDRWWDDHSRTCGGTFIKVKEPEQPTKKTSKPKSNHTINKYFPILKEKVKNCNDDHKPTHKSNVTGFNNLSGKSATGMRINSNGTIVKTKRSIQNSPRTSTISKPVPIATVNAKKVSTTGSDKNQIKDNNDYARVRNHWINKYPNNNSSNEGDSPHNNNEQKNMSSSKQPKLDLNMVMCPICKIDCQPDDINSHLDKCLEEPSELSQNSSKENNFAGNIKNCDENISNKSYGNDGLVACLVCSTIVSKANLGIHLDDCMGDNIFTDNNKDSNEVRNNPDVTSNEMEMKYNCPVCSKKFLVCDMSNHLNVCLINEDIFNEPF